MIGKLRGLVDSLGEDWVVIDVAGVGYHVTCSMRTMSALPGIGEPATLAIETHVREDQIRLFGFAQDVERDWFRLLLGVQGVGPRVALAVLGVNAPGELGKAVAFGDKALIARAPGVGPKVAQRIIAELKDAASALTPPDPALSVVASAANDSAPAATTDAVSALVNLGYGQVQANVAVAAALREAGEGAGTETLIRLGLKELGR